MTKEQQAARLKAQILELYEQLEDLRLDQVTHGLSDADPRIAEPRREIQAGMTLLRRSVSVEVWRLSEQWMVAEQKAEDVLPWSDPLAGPEELAAQARAHQSVREYR